MLLTDEKICKYCPVPACDVGRECLLRNKLKEMAQAEHEATLKAVGELLDDWKLMDEDMKMWLSAWARLNRIIQSLLRGELPE